MFVDVALREGSDWIDDAPKCRPHEKAGNVSHCLAVLLGCRKRLLAPEMRRCLDRRFAASGLSAVTVCRSKRASRSLWVGGSAGNSLTAALATETILFPGESRSAVPSVFASSTSDAAVAIVIFLNRAISERDQRFGVVD